MVLKHTGCTSTSCTSADFCCAKSQIAAHECDALRSYTANSAVVVCNSALQSGATALQRCVLHVLTSCACNLILHLQGGGRGSLSCQRDKTATFKNFCHPPALLCLCKDVHLHLSEQTRTRTHKYTHTVVEFVCACMYGFGNL